MKLATYTNGNSEPKLGVVQGDIIIDLEHLGQKTNITFPNSMLELIDAGQQEVDRIANQLKNAADNALAACSIPVDEVTLLAPIPRPRKNIIGIGLNYTEHVAESARTLDTSNELPQKPIIFSKPPTSVTGTNSEIILNPQ